MRPEWALLLATIVCLGFLAWQLRGRDAAVDNPATAAPIMPETPRETPSQAALIPVPTDTVLGPIETWVRVAVHAVGHAGGPLADTVVHFNIESGGGTLQSEELATTSQGIAVNFVRLPAEPGPVEVTASLPGSGLDVARITAVAVPGDPARVSVTRGDGQEGQVGALLPSRVYVTVRDARGNPVPRAPVSFRTGSGEGETAGDRRTDSTGMASALWRLGPVEGEQTLIASSSGVDEAAVFRATALPRPTMEIDNTGRAETTPVTVRRNAMAVGVSHACRLAGGALQCRGANDRGQSSPEGPLGFVAVMAGASHSCGLSGTGVASCWGANEEGQLGDGTREDRASPTRVRTDLRFSMLTAGEKHTCGLAGAGVPFCWGENLSGQVGDGTRNDQMVPRTVGEGLGFAEIAAGSSHTCGRTPSGNTFCWGANNRGQVGDGSSGLDLLTPTLVRSGISNIVAGHEHTCGIADEGVACWGANTFGQLGDGTTEDRPAPTPVQGLPARATDLAAGALHTCALLSDGRVFCWGQNFAGQLGDGTTQARTTPTEVDGGVRFADVDAGGAQTCALTSEGAQYCWGLNQSGQLGDGTRTNRSTPVRVGG